MASKSQKIEIARSLYIVGKNIEEIADILDTSVRTIQNYRSEDGANGHDWDVLRAEKHIVADPNRREHLYSDFVTYMYETLQGVRDAEIPAEAKADKIVKLSDAFSKMKAIVRYEDPLAYKHGIIKHVIKVIGEGIKATGDKELLERFIEVVDQHGDELDVAL